MSKKDLPPVSGDAKVKEMEEETIPVSWTIDWGAFDAPPESAYPDEDINYEWLLWVGERKAYFVL